MDQSAKRSASVTVAAVVALLCSLFLLLCCSFAFLGMLLVKLPSTASELPPFIRNTALVTEGLLVCLCLFGIATGIGLFYLRNWARISILIWGGFSVFFGAIGIPVAYLTIFSSNTTAPALPAESMQAVRWILLFIYGVPLLIGIWWLILFTRNSVRAQFAAGNESAQPGFAQKPACPLPIAVLAWFYIGSILNLLFLPFLSFRVPIFVFGRVLPSNVGRTVLILSCLAFVLAGIGLLKLKPWSYSLTIGLQIFWLTSSVVSVLSPNYYATMDSFVKEMQASLHLPDTSLSPANFAHSYGWTSVLGLVFAGVVLGLLVYYRARFLDAASKAASAP